MTTLLIGMALAFVLGAVAVTVSACVLSSRLSRAEEAQATSVTSIWKDTKKVASVTTTNAFAEKEKTPEELKKEEYLKQMMNMLEYDGKKQVDAE